MLCHWRLLRFFSVSIYKMYLPIQFVLNLIKFKTQFQ